MTTTTKILKPRLIQAKIKAEVKLLFKCNLPKNWILLFIHDHPKYEGQNEYFSNVKAGRVIPTDKELIAELKSWIKKNKINHGKNNN
jgi:hypothetical protein